MNLARLSQEELSKLLNDAFTTSGKTLALAESCTGGAVAASLVAIPGASNFFLGSIVAYSNEWKESFLGVDRATLLTHGAVSQAVVSQMVEGLFEKSNADFAAAVSGVLGPAGGSIGTPIGTVWVAIGERGSSIDAGIIHAPLDRKCAIEFIVKTLLDALLMRLIHNKKTFAL